MRDTKGCFFHISCYSALEVIRNKEIFHHFVPLRLASVILSRPSTREKSHPQHTPIKNSSPMPKSRVQYVHRTWCARQRIYDMRRHDQNQSSPHRNTLQVGNRWYICTLLLVWYNWCEITRISVKLSVRGPRQKMGKRRRAD